MLRGQASEFGEGRRIVLEVKRGLAPLAALLVAACGAGGSRPAAMQTGPVRGVGLSAPVEMMHTPPALLAVCRGNTLLRPICPGRIPAFRGRIERLGYCVDGHGRDVVMGGHFNRLASSRCVAAGWGLEAGTGLPGYIAGRQVRLSGWNDRRWIPLAGESLLFSPPLHVHVEIAATLVPTTNFGWPVAGARAASRTDALLNQQHAIFLGWMRWHGRPGRLVLAPVFPSGGEWGGHLIFFFSAGRVHYAITLHSWMPALRLTGPGVDRVTRLQPGPALPHVVATLKRIVESARG